MEDTQKTIHNEVYVFIALGRQRIFLRAPDTSAEATLRDPVQGSWWSWH